MLKKYVCVQGTSTMKITEVFSGIAVQCSTARDAFRAAEFLGEVSCPLMRPLVGA